MSNREFYPRNAILVLIKFGFEKVQYLTEGYQANRAAATVRHAGKARFENIFNSINRMMEIELDLVIAFGANRKEAAAQFAQFRKELDAAWAQDEVEWAEYLAEEARKRLPIEVEEAA
jgi:hypothetical protein